MASPTDPQDGSASLPGRADSSGCSAKIATPSHDTGDRPDKLQSAGGSLSEESPRGGETCTQYATEYEEEELAIQAALALETGDPEVFSRKVLVRIDPKAACAKLDPARGFVVNADQSSAICLSTFIHADNFGNLNVLRSLILHDACFLKGVKLFIYKRKCYYNAGIFIEQLMDGLQE
jgi:hypothetical protein